MFLQEYAAKWSDADGIRTRNFEAARAADGARSGRTIADAWGGTDAEDFDRNFADLARKFHVISVDRLNFGHWTARLHGRSSTIDGGR